MSLLCPSCSPNREVTLQCLQADVYFQSGINHSSKPQCTGRKGSRWKRLLLWGLPLSPAPHPVSSLLLVEGIASSLQWPFLCLPPHPLPHWELAFPLLGNPGIPGCFQNLRIHCNASTSTSASECQSTRQEGPGSCTYLPSLQGRPGACSVEWPKDSSPVGLGSKGTEQTPCLTASSPW